MREERKTGSKRNEISSQLEEEGLIYSSHRAKSVALDENAVEQAKALLMQYGIDE